MGFASVIVAGVAAWIFGAVWYSIFAKTWMAASGLTEASMNRKDPVPYIASMIGALLVAGMMRHMFATSGIDTVGKGLVTGLGLGLFVAAPWMLNTVLFGQRDRRLLWIDGLYPVGGCMVIGVILPLW